MRSQCETTRYYFHQQDRVEQARRFVVLVAPFAASNADVRVGIQSGCGYVHALVAGQYNAVSTPTEGVKRGDQAHTEQIVTRHGSRRGCDDAAGELMLDLTHAFEEPDIQLP